MLYLFLRLVGPGVAGLAALPIALTRADGIEAQAAIVLFAVLLVYYAVEKAVSRQADGRKKAVVLEAPDVLDLLVIYTEAGQSLDNALQEVAVRGEKRYPVLCRELRTLLRELALLTSRKAAYDRFAIRCGADIIRRFVNVIQQAENVGAPISRTLRLLAADSRRDRLAEAERRAARIPILIQVPIVLFILPALFLILMGPVAIRVIETLAGTNF
jgi:tight adherence protein C